MATSPPTLQATILFPGQSPSHREGVWWQWEHNTQERSNSQREITQDLSVHPQTPPQLPGSSPGAQALAAFSLPPPQDVTALPLRTCQGDQPYFKIPNQNTILDEKECVTDGCEKSLKSLKVYKSSHSGYV